MNRLRQLSAAVFVLVATSLAGAEPPFAPVAAETAIPAEWLQPSTEPYRIGPGDKLEVEILEVAGTRRTCLVMPDGFIYYDLLPGIRAANLTPTELRDRLVADLAAYYRAPQVSVVLRGIGSRRVWVMGRVNTPGLYPLEAPTTVLDAIARAGGLFASRFSGTTEELADLRHAFLVRDGAVAPVDFNKLLREGDLRQNIYLRDGDYLYLPSALSSQVYVLGAVAVPRAVGFMDRVTVLSALAAARGTLPGADLRKVLIIRGSLHAPTAATVDYQDILRGRAPDVPLEPQDIVWVPNSAWHDLGGYVRVVLNSFVRTVAANEGVRAVDRSAPQPSIPVPTQ